MKSRCFGASATAAAWFAALAFAFCLPASAAEPDLDVKVQIVGEEIRAQVSLFVRAPQQRVWDVITDYERAPQYTRDLQVSRILSRSGEVLRLFQKLLVRFGPFAMPVETLREVRLAAPSRADSRLISGSMKKYDSTIELVPEPGGTRLKYRSQAIPDSVWVVLAGESIVRERTEERFRELRAEILRRENHAALPPQ
jgi:hypothetical protein